MGFAKGTRFLLPAARGRCCGIFPGARKRQLTTGCPPSRLLLLGARNNCRSARLIVPAPALPSASNTSVAVTMPTSRSPSSTGREPISRFRIRSAARRTVVSGSAREIALREDPHDALILHDHQVPNAAASHPSPCFARHFRRPNGYDPRAHDLAELHQAGPSMTRDGALRVPFTYRPLFVDRLGLLTDFSTNDASTLSAGLGISSRRISIRFCSLSG